jgi:hypothetical protein
LTGKSNGDETFVARGGTFCSSANFLKFENLFQNFVVLSHFTDYIQLRMSVSNKDLFTTTNSDLEEMTAELPAAELQPGQVFDNIELENYSNCM